MNGINYSGLYRNKPEYIGLHRVQRLGFRIPFRGPPRIRIVKFGVEP